MHFIPVFCHRSARNLDAFFLKHLRHVLITVRRLLIFFVNDLFNEFLDADGRDSFSRTACHPGRKEICDFENTFAALHVFAIDGS